VRKGTEELLTSLEDLEISEKAGTDILKEDESN
jgi:hypothetical protein